MLNGASVMAQMCAEISYLWIVFLMGFPCKIAQGIFALRFMYNARLAVNSGRCIGF